MSKVLVTGANGQLGQCLRAASELFPALEIFFASRDVLDISSEISVSQFFAEKEFDYCINAAAFTNVDGAEKDREGAFATNALGVKHISEACEKKNTVLLHVSTDYVFDGSKEEPFLESDVRAPINVYGESKLQGEQWIQEICSRYFIVRTSWLYSEFGNNFYNSMLKFAKEKKDLSITTEQIGTPTNANDLAKALLVMVGSGSKAYGIYHYANEGNCTWYDFAEAIFKFTGEIQNVNLAKTDHYPTFAARPKYSVLNKEKFKNTFHSNILDWEKSLQQLIETTNK
jgi:dTDP-4-dehydrorhamnose reductase